MLVFLFLFAYFQTTESTGACIHLLTESAGSIMTPNYPRPYLANTDCVWTIRVHKRRQIRLIFNQYFSLENGNRLCINYDYVEVRDGGSNETQLIDRYCGSTAPSSILSSSNELWIKFHSNGYQQLNGFLANYYEVGDLVVEIRSVKGNANFVRRNTNFEIECYVSSTRSSATLSWRWKPCMPKEYCLWSTDVSAFAEITTVWDSMRISKLTTIANETRTFECTGSSPIEHRNAVAVISIVSNDLPNPQQNEGFTISKPQKAYYCPGDRLQLDCLTQKYLYTDVYWSKVMAAEKEKAINQTTDEIVIESNTTSKYSNNVRLTIRNLTEANNIGLYTCNALFDETTLRKRIVHISKVPAEMHHSCASAMIVDVFDAPDEEKFDTTNKSIATEGRKESDNASVSLIIAVIILASTLLLVVSLWIAALRKISKLQESTKAIAYHGNSVHNNVYERPLLQQMNYSSLNGDRNPDETYEQIPVDSSSFRNR